MTPHSKSGMNMICTQIRCLYISLFMIVGCYHGLNTSSGLLPALLILPWDACVVILSNIESSHMLAGHLWALVPKAMLTTVFQLSNDVLLIVSWYLLLDFGWSQCLVGSGGASQRANILNCVTARSEQLGKR